MNAFAQNNKRLSHTLVLLLTVQTILNHLVLKHRHGQQKVGGYTGSSTYKMDTTTKHSNVLVGTSTAYT